MLCVQQHGAMHLPGESDASNLVLLDPGLLQNLANGQTARLPPVGGTLICPTRIRAGKGLVVRRGRRQHAPRTVDHQRACATGSDIDPKKLNNFLHVVEWDWLTKLLAHTRG